MGMPPPVPGLREQLETVARGAGSHAEAPRTSLPGRVVVPNRFWANRSARFGLAVLALLLLMSLIGPYLCRWPYWRQQLDQTNQAPSWRHWFGTDALGRDTFARLWVGGRLSFGVGATAGLIDLAVGAVYGGVAGYCGGLVDEVMMRLVDVLYGVPTVLVVAWLLVVLRPGIGAVVLALALTSWLGMARLVRGQVLQLREREFILAARAAGAGPGRLLWRHMLPNLTGPLLVWLSWTVPGSIFFEALLSFIGIGVQPPLCSWGSMVGGAYSTFRLHPWAFVFPAAAISLTMLAFCSVSDGLRDALDPRFEV